MPLDWQITGRVVYVTLSIHQLSRLHFVINSNAFLIMSKLLVKSGIERDNSSSNFLVCLVVKK
jgi:hypothetical protein